MSRYRHKKLNTLIGKTVVKGRIVSCRMGVITVKVYLPAHVVRLKFKAF